MEKIFRQAPAKINFGLEVLGKRPDGFHEINTVFVRTGLYDELEFALETDAITLECIPDLGIRPTENLVYRAASLLKDYAERLGLFKRSGLKGTKIRVRKHIPSGAGLGGGSTDAATTLLALKDQWQLPITHFELHTLASTLGSDVPFFLKEQAAVGKGRGEVLTYFDFSLPWWLVIVYPNIHVNTGEAYSALSR
ncbi:MAG TPA: 4-(cytidine 5'-diphospho)-2-C-methyl-D-erythritol kinase, partial [Patescibacteria group bacterium]|nr:4-(cytidine 5'-diphospho)-2-C-methyl-D-erythritol kinase [Patescibacteria group bacterium]